MQTISKLEQFVTFEVEDKKYALPLSVVDRVIRSVEVTSLPKANSVILGVINIQGKVAPVVNLRKRLGLTIKDIGLNDQFVIARAPKRTVAIVVDSATGLIELNEEAQVRGSEVSDNPECVNKVLKVKEEMILVLDLENLLSREDEKSLDSELKEK